jgi:hypothetical protein
MKVKKEIVWAAVIVVTFVMFACAVDKAVKTDTKNTAKTTKAAVPAKPKSDLWIVKAVDVNTNGVSTVTLADVNGQSTIYQVDGLTSIVMGKMSLGNDPLLLAVGATVSIKTGSAPDVLSTIKILKAPPAKPKEKPPAKPKTKK